MKKFSERTKKNKLNILVSIVALILVIATGTFVTYSWIEGSTSITIDANGKIEKAPQGVTEYAQNVTLSKSSTNAIDLSQYVDKVKDFKFSPVSSADGENFYMQSTTDDYKKANTTDKNVSYISLDLKINSEDKTSVWFDNGLDNNGNTDTENHPEPTFVVAGESENCSAVRVAVTIDDGEKNETKLFSQNGGTYNPITDINGTTTSTEINSFADYEYGSGNKLWEFASGDTATMKITIWLEGTDNGINTAYGKNMNIDMLFATSWSKGTLVYFKDKTASSSLTTGSGTLEVYPNSDISTTYSMANQGNGLWKSSDAPAYLLEDTEGVTFKYTTQGGISYTWNAGVPQSYNSGYTYSVFDESSSNACGTWNDTEEITVYQIVDSLTPGTVNEADNHIKLSFDDNHYYRTKYRGVNDQGFMTWTAFVPIDYETDTYITGGLLKCKYYATGISPATATWSMLDGRDKDTDSTYYLLGLTNNPTYADGTWKDDYDIHFVDGTADQIFNRGVEVSYTAYSGSEQKASGSMIVEKNLYMWKSNNSDIIRYTDKIDRVVFTVTRLGSDNQTLTYIWDGSNRTTADIYYTATYYTKD